MKTTVSLGKELTLHLQQRAAKEGRSLSNLIKHLLVECLQMPASTLPTSKYDGVELTPDDPDYYIPGESKSGITEYNQSVASVSKPPSRVVSEYFPSKEEMEIMEETNRLWEKNNREREEAIKKLPKHLTDGSSLRRNNL